MDVWPIERLWMYLTNRVYYEPVPKTREALIRRLKKEWKKIDKDFLKRVVHAIPARLHEISKRKGEQIPSYWRACESEYCCTCTTCRYTQIIPGEYTDSDDDSEFSLYDETKN